MGNVESYLTDGMQVEQRQVPVRNTVTRRCAARPARQPQVGDAVRPVKTIATASQSKTPWNYYTAESKLDKFEEENQRLEEALKRLRQRRLLAFQQELAEFERSNDPFSILGIEATDDADAIKRAYKRQSLRYHPDKGGSEEQFAMITRAYVYIMKKLDRLQYKLATDSNMKSSAQEFVQEQERQPRENIYVDRMKFDPKVFNRVFDDNKMADVNDDGYADIMTSGLAVSGTLKSKTSSMENSTERSSNRNLRNANTQIRAQTLWCTKSPSPSSARVSITTSSE